MKLPVSYRCPKRVIWLAQKLVPDIQAWNDSPDGEIHHIHNSEIISLAKPGSFVLSRTNAPLIKNCMQFIRKGIKANILGKDIGDYFSWIIRKSGSQSPKQFLDWLKVWAEKEIAERISRGRKVDYIKDRVLCFEELCNEVDSLQEVDANIKKMFGDKADKNIVLFATVHSSKGMERDDVFIFHDTLRFDAQESKNIAYVAYTRSKKRLYLASENNPITNK